MEGWRKILKNSEGAGEGETFAGCRGFIPVTVRARVRHDQTVACREAPALYMKRRRVRMAGFFAVLLLFFSRKPQREAQRCANAEAGQRGQGKAP